MVLQLSFRFWLVSRWSAAASAPSVLNMKDGVSPEQRFLWAAKLLFVPRLCILITCTVHSNKERDESWHCSCAKGYEKSPSDTMEPVREGERERKKSNKA